MSMRYLIPVIVVGIILICLPFGCGPSVVTVSGKVAYRGQPVANGSITFLTPDGELHNGQIDASGNYSISNVAAGKVKVGFSGPLIGEPQATASRGGKQPPGMTLPPVITSGVEVPPELGSPETSGLEYDTKKSNKIDVIVD